MPEAMEEYIAIAEEVLIWETNSGKMRLSKRGIVNPAVMAMAAYRAGIPQLLN
jgi:hypothetical protein